MKHLVPSILIAVLTGLLAACVQVSDQQEEETKAQVTEGVRYLPQEEPNSYSVYVPLPAGASQVTRLDLSGRFGTEAFVPLNREGGYFVDHSAIGGAQYEYSFHSVDSHTAARIHSVQVQVPRDFVVNSEIELNSRETNITGYRRVFILSRGVLRTLGRDVLIRAEELISEHGTIESFPPYAVANKNVDGKSGGNLRIEVKKAYGQLKIYMRGEQGGQGRTGDAHAVRAGKGAPGGPARFVASGSGYTCVALGKAPGAGQAGARGHRGYPGQRGGDSGNVYLKISQSQLALETFLEPGKGGDGGDGGPGQQGGAGGDVVHPAGIINWAPCGSPQKGAEGPAGERGPSGRVGTDGLKGKVCHIQGQKMSCS